jgi:hypothetical protein
MCGAGGAAEPVLQVAQVTASEWCIPGFTDHCGAIAVDRRLIGLHTQNRGQNCASSWQNLDGRQKLHEKFV